MFLLLFLFLGDIGQRGWLLGPLLSLLLSLFLLVSPSNPFPFSASKNRVESLESPPATDRVNEPDEVSPEALQVLHTV